MDRRSSGTIIIFVILLALSLSACSLSSGHPADQGRSDESLSTGEEPRHQDGWALERGSLSYYKDNKKVTGWFHDQGATYYFDPTGAMTTGWAKISGKIYNFRQDGKLRSKEWVIDDRGTQYLLDDGSAACGKTTIDGQVYFFSDKGVLLRNRWVGNSYAGEDGIMVTDTEIDGLWIDESGRRIFDGSFGSGGCLFMPSVGIEVPSYKTVGNEEGQRITDEENCAAHLTSFHMPVIADHQNQGFEQIKSCVPGETTAFLLTEKKVRQYRCLSIITGFNVERDITDENGVSIDDYDADLCLYTCNEDWQHVTIVLFEKYH